MLIANMLIQNGQSSNGEMKNLKPCDEIFESIFKTKTKEKQNKKNQEK